MAIHLTPGKIAGLEAVSDPRGVIAALAIDQRGLLKNMLAHELKVTDPPASMMSEFKQHVAAILTREASSILLDVEYGLAATKQINGKGLLLAYEKSGYSPQFPEKLPTLTEGWSVLRLKEAGADAIKILVFYTPFEDPWVNEQKKAWVERVGAECRALDMPCFLEFLSYDVHGEDEKGLAFARRKPEIVRASIEEFTKDRYAADVLKIEVPIQMAYHRRHQHLQRRAGLHRRRSQGPLPLRRQPHRQAHRLPLRRRHQRRLRRNAGDGRGQRRQIPRRARRPRHLAGWRARVRQARSQRP